jgi:MoaA/NifB/PqqE/SkfB family radical SAM enzyme
MAKVKLSNMLLGQNKSVIFSILTGCNCTCNTCDIWKKPNKAVSKEQGFKIIKNAKQNKVSFMSFSGGEPLLHPNLVDFVKYAKDLGMYTHVVSNGSVCTDKNMAELKKAGLDLLGISLDTMDAKLYNKSRGHKGLFNKVVNAVELSKKHKISVNINTLINKHNWNKLPELVDYINNKLGIAWMFCYPTLSPNKQYFSKSSDLLNITKDQLLKALNDLLYLKSQNDNILNSKLCIEESIKYTKGEKTIECRAGRDVYFIDWNGKVYSCFNLSDKNLNKSNTWSKRELYCNNCYLTCFREPSLYYYKWVALTNIGHLIKLYTY